MHAEETYHRVKLDTSNIEYDLRRLDKMINRPHPPKKLASRDDDGEVEEDVWRIFAKRGSRRTEEERIYDDGDTVREEMREQDGRRIIEWWFTGGLEHGIVNPFTTFWWRTGVVFSWTILG